MNTISSNPAGTRTSSAIFSVPMQGEGQALPNQIGEKAHGLVRIKELGLRVPTGLVVTAEAFERFLDQGNLRSEINWALGDLHLEKPDSFERVSRKIKSLVMDSSLPDEAWAEIVAVRDRELGEDPLIIRSSALGEDGEEASFAGQLDSVYPVVGDECLRQSILQCWASYWSGRSLFYQKSGKGQLKGMGVIIQSLVPTAVAGVLFTRDTRISNDGGSARMYGEYCHGHGGDLVAGRINPGRFVIERENEKGWIESPPDESQDDAIDNLLRECLAQLCHQSLILEERLGGPQDIEFVIDAQGVLFFVQSRPVTVPLSKPSPECTTNPSTSRKVIWSNANVNENFPDPICPLLYSIASKGYYHYFRNLALGFGISPRRVDAVEGSLRGIIGIHGARMYYNLTAVHSVLKCAPAGPRIVDYFNRFVGTEGDAHSSQTLPKRGMLEVPIIGCKTTWKYLFLRRRIERFEGTVKKFCEESSNKHLEQRSIEALLGNLRGFLHIRFHQWNNAALADTAAMVTYGLLGSFLRQAFPESKDAGLQNSLMKGIPDLVSGIPPLRLWEISRQIRADLRLLELFGKWNDEEVLEEIYKDPSLKKIQTEIDKYLNEWGFRFSGELMLTVPALDEQPLTLIRWLRSYCDVEGESPAEALDRQARDRDTHKAHLIDDLKKAKPWWSLRRAAGIAWFRLLVRAAPASIRYRERVRLKQAQLYNRCRQIALAAGARLVEARRLDKREDVFFFTWQELEEVLEGTDIFPKSLGDLVRSRKSAHARLSMQEPPDQFTLPEGEFYDPMRANTRDQNSSMDKAEPAQGLKGMSACGGEVEGQAAVIKDLSESNQIRPGDVLVTKQTDPGWGPVFFLIKGLVLERGGMLSHGAIIAREYGIPAVVGVKGATEHITSGQRVRVKADQGHVELL